MGLSHARQYNETTAREPQRCNEILDAISPKHLRGSDQASLSTFMQLCHHWQMATLDEVNARIIGASNKGKHGTNDAAPARAITDALRALLVKRADDPAGCTDGSDEERELEAITNAIEAYEVVRWPLGRTQDGKG